MDKKKAQKFLEENTAEDFLSNDNIQLETNDKNAFEATSMIAGFACKEIFEVLENGNIRKRVIFEALEPNSKENLPEWQKEKLRQLADSLVEDITPEELAKIAKDFSIETLPDEFKIEKADITTAPTSEENELIQTKLREKNTEKSSGLREMSNNSAEKTAVVESKNNISVKANKENTDEDKMSTEKTNNKQTSAEYARKSKKRKNLESFFNKCDSSTKEETKKQKDERISPKSEQIRAKDDDTTVSVPTKKEINTTVSIPVSTQRQSEKSKNYCVVGNTHAEIKSNNNGTKSADSSQKNADTTTKTIDKQQNNTNNDKQHKPKELRIVTTLLDSENNPYSQTVRTISFGKKQEKTVAFAISNFSDMDLQQANETIENKDVVSISLAESEVDKFLSILNWYSENRDNISVETKYNRDLQIDKNNARSSNRIYARKKDATDTNYDQQDAFWLQRAELRELGLPFDPQYETDISHYKTVRLVAGVLILNGIINIALANGDISSTLIDNANTSGFTFWVGSAIYALNRGVYKIKDMKYRGAIDTLRYYYQSSNGKMSKEFVKHLTMVDDKKYPDEYALACMTKEERDAILKDRDNPFTLSKRKKIQRIYTGLDTYLNSEKLEKKKSKKEVEK